METRFGTFDSFEPTLLIGFRQSHPDLILYKGANFKIGRGSLNATWVFSPIPIKATSMINELIISPIFTFFLRVFFVLINEMNSLELVVDINLFQRYNLNEAG